MYTDPGFRGKGLATSIVKSAEDWSRENGYYTITLHASKMGRKLYSELGWKRGWEMYKELDSQSSGVEKRGRASAKGRDGSGRHF
jgi:GNAT superfamily N-acetyltransferase